MLKLMFIPFRVVGGFLAGKIATGLFRRIWAVIDSEQAPAPEQRDASLGKLAAGLVLQGAVFQGVRGLVDHGSRVAFSRLTGRWPGKKRAKPTDERA
jgi:Protein of unknown function (DUF4235)